VTALLTALQAELTAHAGEIVSGLLLAFGTFVTWLVSWFRAHSAVSALRQAQEQHGEGAAAIFAAERELKRQPLRGNVINRVANAVSKQRASNSHPEGA
jgi:uncharacterized protein involved in propanediol utilization